MNGRHVLSQRKEMQGTLWDDVDRNFFLQTTKVEILVFKRLITKSIRIMFFC
jgi:hypothetical protein